MPRRPETWCLPTGMDRYQRIRILGRGSFATVILVRVREGPETLPKGEESLAMMRVVKEVDLTRADEKRRAEALQEVEVLKSLSHPNVIGYEEAIAADGRLCIVMEYADGGDLAGCINRRRASGRRYHEREVLHVFVQLAIALQYIHGRRILHRDLKSQNVFLARAGVVKLGDFGIAKVFEGSDSMAETRIGTPYYLPPEMCNDKPYSYRADVWCLGIVLYELLALEVPFNAPNMATLALKICSSEPRPVPSVYSNEVRALLGRMLSKRAEDRPSSVEIVAMPHVRRGIGALLAHTGRLGQDMPQVDVPAAGMINSSSGPCEPSLPCPEGARLLGTALEACPVSAPPLSRSPSPMELLDELASMDFMDEDISPGIDHQGANIGSGGHPVVTPDGNSQQEPLSPSLSPQTVGKPLSPHDAGQVAMLQCSLKQALMSAESCEELLQELEQEFQLA